MVYTHVKIAILWPKSNKNHSTYLFKYSEGVKMSSKAISPQIPMNNPSFQMFLEVAITNSHQINSKIGSLS